MGLATALALGAWLRGQQWLSQVLMGDEWHAVHQLVYYSPGAAAATFGYADHSIPLVLLSFLGMTFTPFSEPMLRWPMLVAGIALVGFLPWLWRRHFNGGTVLLFALMLATSPLLISYSRLGRPYALTLLLVFAAYALFARAIGEPAPGRATSGKVPGRVATVGYALVAGLAAWAHPVTGPFLVAPLIATGWRLLHNRDARPGWAGLALLTVAAGIVMAAAVLPPLLLDRQALAGKSGVDSIGLDALLGAAHLWLGTGSTWVLAGMGVLVLAGAGPVWRALPEARWLVLGTVLTLVALLATRPWWIDKPAALARYLLPVAPLLLLMLAAGVTRVAARVGGAAHWMAGLGGIGILGAVFMTSPLGDMLDRPNSYGQDYYFHYDYRRRFDPKPPLHAAGSEGAFFARFSVLPRRSATIAVAPFHYSSHEWPVPLWENASRQRVIPAFLWGLCEPTRHGEVPPDGRFALRNAAHVLSRGHLARQGVQYFVYYHPPAAPWRSAPVPQCEAAVRATFGPPDFGDELFTAWRIDPSAAAPLGPLEKQP